MGENVKVVTASSSFFLDYVLYFLLMAISCLLMVLVVHIHCRIYSSVDKSDSEFCSLIESNGVLSFCDDIYNILIPYAEPLVPFASRATSNLKDIINQAAPHVQSVASSCSGLLEKLFK